MVQDTKLIQALPVHGGTAQPLCNLRGSIGHEGSQQTGADAHGFQQVIQHPCQPGLLLLALCQHPGGVFINILVGAGDDLENLCQSVLEGVLLHLLLVAVPQGADHGNQLCVLLSVLSLLCGQMLAKVLLRHGNGTGDQVAQVVGKVHIDGVNQGLVGEIAVSAKGEGAQQEEPQGIHAETLCQHIGIHHVALGLAHLAAVQQQPAVTIDLFGQGQIQAHEHGGPDDGVEAHNLLAHKVDICGPVFFQVVILVVLEAQSGHVVEQCINPHIHHMTRVKIHRHAPGEAGAGHAQVFQAGIDKIVDHLVDAAARLQEIGVHQQIPHPVGVFAQAEEVCFLLCVLHLPSAVGAFAVHQLALGPEGLTGLAVLALVGALVDVAVVMHLLENLLDGSNVIVVGGADEPVIGNVHQLPQILDTTFALYNVVHKLLRGDTGFLCLVLNLLAVFVGAGEEHNVIALEPLEASHGVGCHGAIGVADVKLGGRVVDGGCDIELPLAFFAHNNILLDNEKRPRENPRA